MKNAKITRAFLKSAAENAIKKRRNSICNAFVLWNVLYARGSRRSSVAT